jgi:ribosomal protein L37AE/L43A
VQEYEDILYISKNLVFDGASYWLQTGSIRQGPFCPECYNKDGLLVRLAEQGGEWRCHQCASNFGYERTLNRQPERPAVAMSQRIAKVIPLYK